MAASRLPAVLLASCVLFLTAASAVDAKPFPETRGALREVEKDTLREADRTGAELLREAGRLVRQAREETVALPPTLPYLPSPAQNGALEVRAMLVQPGFQGRDDVLALLWVGATGGTWTGAYWLESDDGMILPRILEVSEEGLFLFMYGGSLSLDDEITGARYHFLGIDGRLSDAALPAIPLLPETPVLGRAAFAGADASARGISPEVVLAAPWNLLDRNATLGMTLLAEDEARDEYVVAGCEDPYAAQTEAGCRLLYALELAPDVTALQLWHLDENGARIVDETHERGTLVGGFTFRA